MSSPIERLLDQLRGGDGPLKRSRAARRLGRERNLPAERTVPALVAALGDRWPEVRAEAARSLVAIGQLPELVLPALIERARDRRMASIELDEALGQLLERAIRDVPLLTGLAKHSSRLVRAEAAGVLGCCDPADPEVIPALIRLLEDMRPSVRSAAASSLRQHGGRARAALPSLVKALHDDSRRVRKGVIAALGTVGAGSSDAILPLTELLASEPSKSIRELIRSTLGALKR